MLNTDQFSVVIPTLNTRKEFLIEALACLQEQTLKPHEIIVVNNGRGSIDIDGIGLPIQVIDTVYKAGVAQARNFGASVATGRFIAFLDDDDLWAKDYLEKMSLNIQENDVDCFIARLDQLVGGHIRPYKNSHGKITKNVILSMNPGITGSSVIVKRESFLKVGGYDPKLPPSEDKALVLDLLISGFQVSSAPECQAILRQHSVGERLSDAQRMEEGISQFYRRYNKEMNVNQKIFNLLKIYRYRCESKKSLLNFFIFLVLGFVHRISGFSRIIKEHT